MPVKKFAKPAKKAQLSVYALSDYDEGRIIFSLHKTRMVRPDYDQHSATRNSVAEMFRHKNDPREHRWQRQQLVNWIVQWTKSGGVTIGCMKFNANQTRILKRWALSQAKH